jgi:IclR family pca regulon transcriptional regulator
VFAEVEGTLARARSAEFVQSLERGLAVIRAFRPERTHLSLTEVAKAAGLTRAAARRFLLTLVELGYVRNEGREFSLQPKVLELGYAYLSGLQLPRLAQPHLERLVKTVQEAASLAVLDGEEIVYVARWPTKRVMSVAVAVGTRRPAHCTSLGRVLLASLPAEELDRYLARASFRPCTRRTLTDPAALRAVLAEIAASGFALVDQELEDGLISLATPVHDGAGAVVAALNVSASALRFDATTLKELVLPHLLASAARIEDELGALSDPAMRSAKCPLEDGFITPLDGTGEARDDQKAPRR